MLILSLAGLALVAAALVDIALTTLTSRGAGPVTSRLTAVLWEAILRGHRRKPSHRRLALTGLLMLSTVAVAWVTALWAGWSLVFMGAGEGAVVEASTGRSADAVSRIYFAGYNLFTLGLGDYRPKGDVWQIMTVLCSANGLLATTLAVTYLVPIVSAATAKRSLAIYIGTLGTSPADILRESWNGERFDLEGPLDDIGRSIIEAGQQHLAYPVLHYFHPPQPANALPLRLAALAEALRLLGERVPPEARPRDRALQRAARAVSSFLAALHVMHVGANDREPPELDLAALRAAGLPISEMPLDGDPTSLGAERKRLLAVVEADGWAWDDLFRS